MIWQFNPLALPLLSSSIIILIMAAMARQRNQGLAINLFLVFMVSAAGLNLAYGLELLAADPALILFWVKVEFFFLYLPGLWLLFLLAYTGHERWLTRRNVILLLTPSSLYTLLAWTNDWHHLNWATVGAVRVGSFVMFDRTYGPGFYLGAGYLYIILLASFIVMIVSILRSPALYRNQIRLLIMSASLPLIGSFITIGGLSPVPKLDWMPIGYILGCLPMAWSLFRYRLLDLVPMAHGQVIGSMGDLVLVTDINRRIVNANPAAAHWLGYSSANFLMGAAIDTILPGAVGEIELTADGASRCFEPRLSPFYDQRQQLRGYVIVLRDITERKQAQETIRQYAQELEARNRELNAFNHTVAHDLKNPVTNMVMTAQMLSIKANTQALDETYLQERLSDIQAAGYKMNHLIEGLLLLARLPASDVMAIRVDMNSVVQAAVDRFKHDLKQRHISIRVENDLPAAYGQPIWLEEVIANLISNAIKYMGQHNPDPRITIRGYRQGDVMRYEVQDNGVGIPEQNQAQLFEMFSRFHKTEAAGLGIGLSIVLRIVTRLKGQVGLESKVDTGSTFWFTLPVQDAAAVAKTGDAG